MLEHLFGNSQVVVILGPYPGTVAEQTQTQGEDHRQRELEAEHPLMLTRVSAAFV